MNPEEISIDETTTKHTPAVKQEFTFLDKEHAGNALMLGSKHLKQETKEVVVNGETKTVTYFKDEAPSKPEEHHPTIVGQAPKLGMNLNVLNESDGQDFAWVMIGNQGYSPIHEEANIQILDVFSEEYASKSLRKRIDDYENYCARKNKPLGNTIVVPMRKPFVIPRDHKNVSKVYLDQKSSEIMRHYYNENSKNYQELVKKKETLEKGEATNVPKSEVENKKEKQERQEQKKEQELIATIPSNTHDKFKFPQRFSNSPAKVVSFFWAPDPTKNGEPLICLLRAHYDEKECAEWIEQRAKKVVTDYEISSFPLRTPKIVSTNVKYRDVIYRNDTLEEQTLNKAIAMKRNAANKADEQKEKEMDYQVHKVINSLGDKTASSDGTAVPSTSYKIPDFLKKKIESSTKSTASTSSDFKNEKQ